VTAITATEVDTIDYAFAPQPWPFAEHNASAIDAHWDQLCAGNDRLFNGRVLVAHLWDVVTRDEGRVLKAAASPCDYKAFLAWRDFGFPDPERWNLFAMAALQAADGPFLVGCMGAHTANAGRVYFPAGTPDLNDVRGTQVDLLGSVLRELEEETGVAAIEVEPVPGWTIVVDGPRVACMKRLRSPRSAADLLARFADFQARETDPELHGLEAVTAAPDLEDPRMPPFMLHYLRAAAQAPGR
jgi:8-oxo-dGTP pyrophosphatase MutT (NUDIX family)